MQSDISMALKAEIHKMHNRERLKSEPKSPFPMKKEEKKKFPSEEIQEAVQKLLQNALNSQKGLEVAPIINTLPFNLPAVTSFSSHAVQIAELFKEMVGCMVHCKDSGIEQTSIVLDAPEFSKSLFYGAKITITEYSTAPKIYNIEFSASPEALKVFQMSASELMAAFQNGNFGFEVNRIDAHFSDQKKQKGKIIPPIEKEKGRHP